MRFLVLVLLASGVLSAGCVKRTVIPDPSIPHPLSRDAKLWIWVDVPGGKAVEQKVKFHAGDYCAGPLVVEGDAP